MAILRKCFGYSLIAFGFGTLFVMDQATLVMNASKSLPDNAFLVFENPLWVRRGSVVAIDMPAPLKDRFEDAVFVKIVVGMPGDIVRQDAYGTPCVNGTCYPLLEKGGEFFAEPIPEGRIPAGHYAVFGESDDSLDSRYKMIGLMPEKRIRGTGFAIPFPEWRKVAGWFGTAGNGVPE